MANGDVLQHGWSGIHCIQRFFRVKFPVEQLPHEDKHQRFNLEASQALGPCTNPDPARTGEAEHLYRSKNTATCRDLSAKKDKERWNCPKEAKEMPFLPYETWLQNQIDLQRMSPSYLSRTLATLLPSLLRVQLPLNSAENFSLYSWMHISHC